MIIVTHNGRQVTNMEALPRAKKVFSNFAFGVESEKEIPAMLEKLKLTPLAPVLPLTDEEKAREAAAMEKIAKASLAEKENLAAATELPDSQKAMLAVALEQAISAADKE